MIADRSIGTAACRPHEPMRPRPRAATVPATADRMAPCTEPRTERPRRVDAPRTPPPRSRSGLGSSRRPARAAAITIALLPAVIRAEPPVLFTNVTSSAGIDFVETLGDDDMTNIVESAGVGCGFLDFDRDGWMDVYLVNGCWTEGLSDPAIDGEKRKKLAGATAHLYRNRHDGTFEDVTARAGLGIPGYGMGMAVADYDADGDPDLYLTNYGPNRLFRNDGDGTFTDVAKAAGVDDPRFSAGAVFLDYNRDGRLDLYVANYVAYDPSYRFYYAPDGFPGPLDYTGVDHALYRGNGDGTFTDVTVAAGIKIEPKGRGMGVAAADFDGDGWTDIMVANDAMENFYWHNRRDGTFENQALERGVAYGRNGEATAAMGIEVADYDEDGRFDFFVPDMSFSCLYHNSGDGVFEDYAVRSGVAPVLGPYVGWAGLFADFDLDGHIDLCVSNGDVHHLEGHEDVVFVGDGQGRFTDASETAGAWFAEKHVGRGAAQADFDNDGDVDVLVTNLNDRPALLRNDTPRRGRHWLSVVLIGQPPNRDALGAVVKVEAGGKTQSRLRRSGGSYLSQHDSRLHFGMGEGAKAVRVEVLWPSGVRQVLSEVPVDQYATVREAPGERKGGGP